MSGTDTSIKRTNTQPKAIKKRKTHDKNGNLLNKCTYINPIKNRQCGMECRKDQIYCFAHIHLLTTTIKEESNSNLNNKKLELNKLIIKSNSMTIPPSDLTKLSKNGSIVKRVPCPVDPTHSIWEDKLKGHILKCNATKKKNHLKEMEKNVDWYSCNYNVLDSPNINNDKTEIDEKIWIELLDKWVKLHDGQFDELELNEIEYTDGLEQRFEELKNQKHIRQQSSLIGQLFNAGLIGDNRIIIEFGCGRAEFSRYLNKAIDNKYQQIKVETKYLLIDRENPRLKFDAKICSDSEELGTKSVVERLKVDIKDLKLHSALNKFKKSESKLGYIGISKHLCGVATDLTLRCLSNEVSDDSSNNFEFLGFLVAMCCRHCCQWDWLLPESKEYLAQFGIDFSNFKYFRKMFSWATNGINEGFTKDDTGDHFSGLTFGEREQVGLKMRRILDESRKYAMVKRGFNVELVKYVKRDYSLENICMLIKKQ
ncbi:tRNA:m4X modification enzyme [Martiniozyma asiatica (nom. inval.)]|nr:tRNA:m4X modification enzyme [Martiniozyma asiatica]